MKFAESIRYGGQLIESQENSRNFLWISFPIHPLAYNLYSDKVIANFLEKLNISNVNDCWLWKGAKNNRGYGQLRIAGTSKYVHRMSWELVNGMVFPQGLDACHSCDNPGCCNPKHIRPGTRRENVQDMFLRGRGYLQRHSLAVKGEDNNFAKLSDKNALEIFRLIEVGVPQTEIAKRFNVSKHTISSIATGKTWQHLAPSNFVPNKERPKGENHSMSKLTQEQVAQIKVLLQDNVPHRKIAVQFGVSKSLVTSINTGKCWR